MCFLDAVEATTTAARVTKFSISFHYILWVKKMPFLLLRCLRQIQAIFIIFTVEFRTELPTKRELNRPSVLKSVAALRYLAKVEN